MLEILTEQIEEKRMMLAKIAKETSFTSELAIKCSTELDDMLNEYETARAKLC